MAELVFEKSVVIRNERPDRYGRTVGRIDLDPCTRRLCSVNAEMVRLGMAWVYPRYNTNPGLPAVQAEAQTAGVGLWHDKNPVPPWEWRRP